MGHLTVDTSTRNYRIDVEPGIVNQIGTRLREMNLRGRVAVITDERVGELYGDPVEDSLQSEGFELLKIWCPEGERSKSISQARRLYELLIENKLKRTSTIVALGGGVIGDLAGFVASTYLRGLTLIQIPTTLLAQVDSSVGGKTGLNLTQGKNLVGTFYQPNFVAIDPRVLLTLPIREWCSGMGEVFKYGLIRDKDLFDRLQNKYEDLVNSPSSHLSLIEDTVLTCCSIKAKVVNRDERDRGLRQILNFGHTIGHALEAASDYGYFTHGEAVVWGMVGESRISFDRGLLSSSELNEVAHLIELLDLPSISEKFSSLETVTRFVSRDKKSTERELRCVLLEKLGGGTRVSKIQSAEVLEALKYLSNLEKGS